MGDYVLPKVKAKYAYQRQNEDELSFEKGAIIQVSRTTAFFSSVASCVS